MMFPNEGWSRNFIPEPESKGHNNSTALAPPEKPACPLEGVLNLSRTGIRSRVGVNPRQGHPGWGRLVIAL